MQAIFSFPRTCESDSTALVQVGWFPVSLVAEHASFPRLFTWSLCQVLRILVSSLRLLLVYVAFVVLAVLNAPWIVGRELCLGFPQRRKCQSI